MLLVDSLGARNARLAADDMVSTDEAAELAGTSRVTINAWIDKGRCIGLTQTKRGYRLPRWQFEPRVWSVLPQLAAALDTRDGWQLLAFLESPHGALGGATPLVAIEQGRAERVLAIAGQEGN
jgi:excisionase family DNA binding protein